MLEWYRANEDYGTVMADTVVVIAQAAQTTGIGTFSFRGKVADPFAEPDLLTVADAFARFAGIDLLATIPDGQADRAALASGGPRTRFVSPMTTHGQTSSARFWSSMSSRIWDRGASHHPL